MYKWILLAHVLGGATLFGAHVYMEGLMASAGKAGDDSTYMTLMLRMSSTASRLMGPASLITLVFGVWLVIDSGFYEFNDFFITIGFAIIIAAFAISMFLIRPRSVDIDAAIEENGLTDAAAVSGMKSISTLVHVQTLLVSIAFVAMVIKPGTL
ncbi:MAG: DUF2269 family protein [Acidimicrobiia bacterium]